MSCITSSPSTVSMVNNSSSPLTAKLIFLSSPSLLIVISPSICSIVNLGFGSAVEPKCRLFVTYKELLIITSPSAKSPSISGLITPSAALLLSIISLLLSFTPRSFPASYPISILPLPSTIF